MLSSIIQRYLTSHPTLFYVLPRSNDLGCIAMGAMSALEKTYKKRAPDRGALLTLLRMFT
jgi:hypothetical protein